jgi:hypothetical protein
MPDRFDEAIDRAVREMLDVEPRADLRARVIAQLPASGSRLPAHGFRLPGSGWVLAPLAAAALIVLAVFIARRTEPLPQAPQVAAAVDRRLPLEVAPPSVAPPLVRQAGREPNAVPPPPRAANTGTVLAADFAGDDHATTVIDPLKTIAPIAMRPIARDTIAPAEIAVRPLNTITEVQIAPLTPPDGR